MDWTISFRTRNHIQGLLGHGAFLTERTLRPEAHFFEFNPTTPTKNAAPQHLVCAF
jgi:hypothetical protein